MKTALLIIDVQECFTQSTSKEFIIAIEALQTDYSDVFISRFFNYKGSGFIKHLDWQSCFKDSREFQLAFTPDSKAMVFDKNTYSSFHEKMSDFDEIHICGLETDACILKTALDLFEHNIRPVVLSELCCSNGGNNLHQAALKILQRNIGKAQVV